MNKRQKLVQQQFLNNEEAVIKSLKQTYGQSYKDITKKVADLDESIAYLQEVYDGIEPDGLTGAALDYFASRGKNPSPEQAQETVKSMIQSKVYQKGYQKALGKQVGDILDKMHTKEFKTVTGYLNACYEDGFIGAMFDLQGQGIPLCFPLDQEAMVRAVQLDSKISKGLYTRLGEDVSTLKKHITAEISRGIANGMSYEKIAQQIGFKMMGTYDTPGGAYAKAVRIARTEGHRIQVQGTMDACYKAKEKGADVVKQWDSTLDSSTRESHVHVDGEIRELDKAFSNGLMFPGDPSGGASEVVNCRCALLQRARWGLDEAELQTLKERAEYFGLDKSETFEEYKNTYLKASKELTNITKSDNIQMEGFSRYLNSSEQLFKNAKKVKPIAGYEDVFIHGDKSGFSVKNKDGVDIEIYSPREFAEILKADPNYHGGAIRLFACDTASEGATAAQSLANQLGVEILAPSNIVWIDSEGNHLIGSKSDAKRGINTGQWVRLKPKEKG